MKKINKKNVKSKLHEAKGVTLIALVVSIIVLIILAAIGLSLALGDNGLINRSKNAASMWGEGTEKEQNALSELGYFIKSNTMKDTNLPISISQNNNNFTITVDNPEEGYEYEFYIDGVLMQKGESATYTQKIALENKEPYIPTGFTHTEGSVDIGYVIKDTQLGNEFVWIPVSGKSYTAYVKASDGRNITLQSDEFGISASNLTRNLDCAGLTIDYTEWHEDEGDINDKKSIAYFKQSVAENGGFYMGRYEMGMPGQKTGDKPILDFTNEARNIKGTPVCVKGVMPWTNIDYDVAKENLESMYNGEVQSAMLNSYARTTTLNWINSNILYTLANYQDTFDNSRYSIKGACYTVKATGPNEEYNDGYNYLDDYINGSRLTVAGVQGGSILLTTGANLLDNNTSQETGFAINNIYDLGGNAGEWSTEIKNGSNNHRISGGSFISGGARGIDYNASAYIDGLDGTIDTTSRPILYK